MATNFPSSLDAFTNPTSGDTLDNPPHDQQHADVNDAVEALQAKVGVDGSAVTSSLDYRVAGVEQTLSSRNLLYNGAMQVAQRGTSTASITTSGYYTADRWNFAVGTMGTWTQSVENDAPTGSGFRKSLKVLCTAADAAPAAGDLVLFYQPFEGFDLQQIKKGTSSAEQLTVSFWVKSNVTGTYIAELYDVDNTRQVSASYSVVASGTWEKKTITFPADTTGVLDNDNATSLAVQFWLGTGTTYSSGTLNTSWASNTNANRAVGQTNLAAATNNYWQVTGVQLEVGPQATPFEHLPYGDELLRCQRYFERLNYDNEYLGNSACTGTGSGWVYQTFAVTKRAVPTFSIDGSIRPLSSTGSIIGTTNATSVAYFGGPNGGLLSFSGASGLAAGDARGVFGNAGCFLNFASEL